MDQSQPQDQQQQLDQQQQQVQVHMKQEEDGQQQQQQQQQQQGEEQVQSAEEGAEQSQGDAAQQQEQGQEGDQEGQQGEVPRGGLPLPLTRHDIHQALNMLKAANLASVTPFTLRPALLETLRQHLAQQQVQNLDPARLLGIGENREGEGVQGVDVSGHVCQSGFC